MTYCETVTLRDGRFCLLRSAGEDDARAVLDCFELTHGETDYLLTYPGEMSLSEEQEGEFLRKKEQSPGAVELLALVDGRVVGTAGIDAVGTREKLKHRASLGISVEKAFWSLGIGRALLRGCVACAKAAGYAQLELEAVAENGRALSLYESEGFTEYGRNPLGFRTRGGAWQELVLMRLPL